MGHYFLDTQYDDLYQWAKIPQKQKYLISTRQLITDDDQSGKAGCETVVFQKSPADRQQTA